MIVTWFLFFIGCQGLGYAALSGRLLSSMCSRGVAIGLWYVALSGRFVLFLPVPLPSGCSMLPFQGNPRNTFINFARCIFSFFKWLKAFYIPTKGNAFGYNHIAGAPWKGNIFGFIIIPPLRGFYSVYIFPIILSSLRNFIFNYCFS